MTRGNLIVYDSTGKIYYQSGEIDSGELPIATHVYPVGVPYIEVPYGSTKGKRIIFVDVSKTPHKLITEDIETKPSYEELENKVLLLENENVEGGIF